MLKTVFIYLMVVALLGLLFISASQTQMEKIAAARSNTDDWWGTYKSPVGDLCGMAYLDFVSNFNKPDENLRYTIKNGQNDIELYLRGDSYSRSIPPGAYSFLTHFFFSNHWDTDFAYRLDRTKKNVLIFEISERFLQEDYNNPRVQKYFWDIDHTAKDNDELGKENEVPNLANAFFNKNISRNLEYNLFNYRFITPLFESKAALNYYFFGRASGDVQISDDRQFLLLGETMAPTGTHSSYSKLHPDEVDSIVDNLNTISDHYKANGFGDVYFCIIPNPVTVLQPGDAYNCLLPLVQYNTRLRMKMIDLYKVFRLKPDLYYAHGDTHWNNHGRLVWINAVNELLEHIHSGQSEATH